jgi:hypothetical protein
MYWDICEEGSDSEPLVVMGRYDGAKEPFSATELLFSDLALIMPVAISPLLKGNPSRLRIG